VPTRQNGSSNGNTRLVDQHPEASRELDDFRATCRRQGHVIDALTRAVLALRSGTAALKADNADLRADLERLHGRQRDRRNVACEAARPVELRLELDAQAPAAARAAVSSALCDRVPVAVLNDARLLISELVTNSVLHSGASLGGSLVLRVQLSNTMVRLDVEDGGGGDAVGARTPDLAGGGGFGLYLVHTLSERWGIERAVAGGTCVWAQLSLSAVNDSRPSSSSRARAEEAQSYGLDGRPKA
jgi:anti-sigma regulatory factor (Ser/Thr protein kinase)